MALVTIWRWEFSLRSPIPCGGPVSAWYLMGKICSKLSPILGLPPFAKIVLGGILWGALFFLIGAYFTQDIRDGIDPKGFVPPPVWGRVPAGFFVLLLLLYIGAFLAGVVSLFRLKFLNAICLISVAYSIHVPIYALDAIRGDRTRFTDGPHREIADIYHGRHSDFVFPGPRLVPLDDQCHPPNWCTCWVIWDPHRTWSADNDLGRWHEPKSSAFPTGTLPIQFDRVDVRRLDSDAYSVLACGYTGE